MDSSVRYGVQNSDCLFSSEDDVGPISDFGFAKFCVIYLFTFRSLLEDFKFNAKTRRGE
jgi:hypothetical protein